MAEVVEKIIKIESAGSQETVRGLKKEIDSLRDALLNVEKGGDDYKKLLEQLIGDQKRLADVMSAGKNEVSAATGSYNALRNEMSALKKVWAEVTDETSRNEIGKRIGEINTQLKDMDASIGNFQRNVGNYKSARQELSALKAQMDNLEVGTAEYNAAFQRAAEITHNLQERQEMLRYSAADLGTQLSNISGIAAGLMGGFNALQGVLALTGDKSEELQKTMMKLQAGIAIVQGLQGLEGMTKKAKGFLNAMTEMVFATNQTTTAIEANTVAQEANAVATGGATVATKAFQKALVATGIGAIIVLIGSLIAHWEDFKDMVGLSNDKLEQFQGIMDKVKTVLGGVANVIMNAFVGAVKNAITAITTLGEVTKNVLTFQFGKAADAAKDGWKKIAENSKKGWDIVNNYNEGAAKTAAKIQEKRTADALKKSAEELNETIKDNEAKYGSDWKYTKEGKKLYDQYFDTKLKAYKKDSKEYRELNREKMAFDREYAEHFKRTSKAQSKQTKTQISDEEKLAKQELDNIAKIQKRAEDAAKDELQLLKEKYEEEKALFVKYEKDTTALTAEYEKKKADIIKKANEAAERERTRAALDAANKALNKSEDKYNEAVTKIELEYSLKEAKESGSLSFNDLIEETNRIYEANKQHLLEQAAEYKSLMENNQIDLEARKYAERDYNNTMAELRALDTQNLIDNTNLQKEAVEAQIDMYRDLAESIGDIFGSIADMLQDDIKRKVENGEITQEEGEKQFKAVKAFQIAQATIQTISGAIAAFMSCQSTYPQPYGAIIGAVQAAAVTAAGVAQIAKIKNTQLGASSSVGSAAATPVQTAPEEYVAPYTQNATGESEIVNLANSIKDQKVILVESDVTAAQEKAKRVRVESTW
jgi:chromosome segregation ATPase